jgi:Iap family predicted aminopeptidase
VQTLAESIGRREATSAAYLRAAALVEARLRALGYRVRRQSLAVPAGNSWGVPVRAGTTVNVVAEPPGPPHPVPARQLLVGAHLDTVPASPGANDNASGVAVMLELARLARLRPPPAPVTFVAFGAEEPRGPGDDDHHFGSRAYVAAMPPAARDALAGMVSLDRVGYGGYVPVCIAGRGGGWLAPALHTAARQLGVPARLCLNRTSDHWSFVRAGLVGVRVGSHPHPGYHSPGDRARLVDPARLDSVGRVVWRVLSAGPPAPTAGR